VQQRRFELGQRIPPTGTPSCTASPSPRRLVASSPRRLVASSPRRLVASSPRRLVASSSLPSLQPAPARYDWPHNYQHESWSPRDDDDDDDAGTEQEVSTMSVRSTELTRRALEV